jgi:serine/threonine-protein kinase HipA
MSRRCLYCYQPLETVNTDFHDRCSLKFFGQRNAPVLPYSLSEMAELAKNVVERSIAVPGVQPKLSLTLVDDVLSNGQAGRLTVVGALRGHYIFKPPSDAFPEMPQNEHVTMRIAEAFGIQTVPSSLIRLASGELSYITRRIDRTESGTKIHMLDMYQVLEAFDKYKGSLEKTGKAIGEYSTNTLLDKLNFFELNLFCFITGNNDMHLKNFSLIHSGKSWLLSPAYDLLNVVIVNPGDTEETALTLEGKKKKLKHEHFTRFGQGLGLTDRQIAAVFKRLNENKTKAVEWINASFLSDEFKVAYKNVLNKKYDKLAPGNATVPKG